MTKAPKTDPFVLDVYFEKMDRDDIGEGLRGYLSENRSPDAQIVEMFGRALSPNEFKGVLKSYLSHGYADGGEVFRIYFRLANDDELGWMNEKIPLLKIKEVKALFLDYLFRSKVINHKRVAILTSAMDDETLKETYESGLVQTPPLPLEVSEICLKRFDNASIKLMLTKYWVRRVVRNDSVSLPHIAQMAGALKPETRQIVLGQYCNLLEEWTDPIIKSAFENALNGDAQRQAVTYKRNVSIVVVNRVAKAMLEFALSYTPFPKVELIEVAVASVSADDLKSLLLTYAKDPTSESLDGIKSVRLMIRSLAARPEFSDDSKKAGLVLAYMKVAPTNITGLRFILKGLSVATVEMLIETYVTDFGRNIDFAVLRSIVDFGADDFSFVSDERVFLRRGTKSDFKRIEKAINDKEKYQDRLKQTLKGVLDDSSDDLGRIYRLSRKVGPERLKSVQKDFEEDSVSEGSITPRAAMVFGGGKPKMDLTSIQRMEFLKYFLKDRNYERLGDVFELAKHLSYSEAWTVLYAYQNGKAEHLRDDFTVEAMIVAGQYGRASDCEMKVLREKCLPLPVGSGKEDEVIEF
ncbi:hypothetical protein HOH87_05955 [bacterium]|jgi:hypothetical protein|nr:hypothetical protein [bacterium]